MHQRNALIIGGDAKLVEVLGNIVRSYGCSLTAMKTFTRLQNDEGILVTGVAMDGGSIGLFLETLSVVFLADLGNGVRFLEELQCGDSDGHAVLTVAITRPRTNVCLLDEGTDMCVDLASVVEGANLFEGLCLWSSAYPDKDKAAQRLFGALDPERNPLTGAYDAMACSCGPEA